MPAIAALTINDGLATPVSHTFTPVRIDEKGVATLLDRSSGIPVGYPRITVSLREPLPVKNGSKDVSQRNYKVVITVDVPTVAYIDGGDVAYRASGCTARLEMVLPESSSTNDRKNLVAFLKNSLSDSSFKKVFEDLEAYY